MPAKISKKEIKQRVRRIEDVYQKYIARINQLKKEQAKIIGKFIKELEQRKIEELKKTLE